MAGKPSEAVEAEAYEANEAKTNEADCTANEANVVKEANVIDKIVWLMRPMKSSRSLRPTRPL